MDSAVITEPPLVTDDFIKAPVVILLENVAAPVDAIVSLSVPAVANTKVAPPVVVCASNLTPALSFTLANVDIFNPLFAVSVIFWFILFINGY